MGAVWLILVAVGLCTSELQLPPTVNVLNSNEFNFGSSYNNQNVTKIGERTYSVPRGMSQCILVCTAKYPVTWIFHNAHFIGHASWMLSLRTRRTAKNIFDFRTYEYMSIINVYGNYNRLSGNYTCAHAARTSLQSSVYMFWQDDSRQQFIQANESRTVYEEDNVAVLPCISGDPDFRNPILTKIGNENATELLAYNSSVRFQRRRGIILDKIPFLRGNYTCRPSGSNPGGEFMNIQVKLSNESDPTGGWLRPTKSNATLTFDPVTSKLKCCSSTRRSPLMMHHYCNHPAMCEFRKKFVVPDIYNSYLRKKSRRGCTTVKLYVHSAGLVHCIGDGVDTFQQYVFGMRDWSLPRDQQKTTAYFDWSEINPHDMMLIRLNNYYGRYWSSRSTNPIAPTLYNGQMLYLNCYVSEYYFSEGIRWGIKWKNNTIQVRDVAPSIMRNPYRYDYNSITLKISAHVDMDSVMCIAPVWNSTEYVHKPYPLYVNISSKPVLNDTVEEFYTWTMNDTHKEISCSAFGVPIPTYTWEKMDDWWHTSHMNLNHTQEVDAVKNFTREKIRFDIVSYTTNGTYICTVSNFGGSVTRKIHIFVEEPASWKKAVAVTVGVSLSLVLVLAVVIMGWKVYTEKRLINQLSSAVTFKDGNIRPEPPIEPIPDVDSIRQPESIEHDYTNSTLDPCKLSANLID